jgi:hypothetical protein
MKTILHPPDSLNLAPSDFYMFGSGKNASPAFHLRKQMNFFVQFIALSPALKK